MRPPFLSSLLCLDLLLFHFPWLLPFGQFPLAFLAFTESENVRHDTAGFCFDLVLGCQHLHLLLYFEPPCRTVEAVFRDGTYQRRDMKFASPKALISMPFVSYLSVILILAFFAGYYVGLSFKIDSLPF